MNELRIAMVGCGAVAGNHLQAVRFSERASVTALVDRDLSQARRFEQEHPNAVVLDDYRNVAEVADAAVIALPHSLHAAVSIELLQQGVHVLVEKPMARTTSECDAMIAAAEQGSALLAVGLVRRCSAAMRFVKDAIDSGLLGTIERFDYREGTVPEDPMSSFRLERDAGGGVLEDMGIHALDALAWWFGSPLQVEYTDDSRGGVESDCRISMTFERGIRGTVELSRIRNLRNTCCLEGTRGSLEVELGFSAPTKVHIRKRDSNTVAIGHAMCEDGFASDVHGVFGRQIESFVSAIDAGEPLVADGQVGRQSVMLLETCRAVRQQASYPWEG